ncbi:PrgI family protein [Dactylosporangium sp. AC04546]|uniref:PrgI family protein n=1 Tax=Dactylosporangium sp. AC04546 TaxID=2862460 RepID=UPI001EDF0CD3|nr:PrgI family protein [Dactylosporangium sp. AC04546]WVK78935.1 PrgI family protein [Dactylosporangium sp. AC04546]
MADELPRAAVPADIDAPDTVAWNLTFRQLAIVGVVAGLGWLLYSRFGPLLPTTVWVAAGIPVAAATMLVALGRRDGLSLDVWLRHGVALLGLPKVQAPGATGAPGAPGRPGARRSRRRLVATTAPVRVPAPLRLPTTTITADGLVTVDGVARCVIACGTTNAALRTGAEQATLLDGFGQWLNALTTPAQLVISAQRHDLAPYAQAVLDHAAQLPHQALRAGTEGYAAFLLDLDATRAPLRRQVLAVVAPGPARDATVRAFTGLGLAADPLDGSAVCAALAAAVDPFTPPAPGPRAVPSVPVTRAATRATSRVRTAELADHNDLDDAGNADGVDSADGVDGDSDAYTPGGARW